MDRIELRYPQINPVFFIGASKGGVEALKHLAENMPENFPAPLFFILHRKRGASTEKQDLLPGVIRRKSKLKVVVPETGDVVQGGRIYLPQKDRHLIVEDNRIRIQEEPEDSMWRPCIDVLFKSGARDYQERAVTVLLTGGLDDGVEGLKETTFQGGITIAQSPEDAYDPILPLNALLEDHPSYVLPLKDMPALFCELLHFEHFDDQRQILEKAAITAAVKRDDVEAEQD